MSSKKFSLFSGIIILLYVTAVFFFLGGLVIESNRGAKTSQDYFEHLTISVEQLHETETILSPAYVATLKELADTTPYIQAILLKKDSVPFLAYPTTNGLIKQDENKNPVITSSSPVIKMHTKTVSLGSSGTVTITAAVSTITKEAVFDLAVKSFILVIITTVVVLIHLIATRKNRPAAGTAAAAEVSETETAAEPIVYEAVEEHDTAEEVVDVIEVDPVAETPAAEEQIPETPVEPAPEATEPVLSAATDPVGLFSPVTGFCWESYLDQRLETELNRAASVEEDLAVFHIRLLGCHHENPQLKPVFDQLLQFFQFRDLIFNTGKDGYVCVVPNISIEGAMNASEKLYSLLQEAMGRCGISTKIVIGISTRTMRLISSTRLLTEAAEAVAHALEEEDMPIVAFQVNQEKYREYLEEEAKKVQDVQTLLQDSEL